ncbi:MAG: CPBP family intramembrane metalloprotease [Solirubrobacterales bacterium]|nr:CPBP family intramembrane metalloprotease [Solirubrobacterales bacterium]
MPWPIWTVPAAFAVGLLVGVLATTAVAGIGRAAGSSTDTPAVNIVGDIVFDLSFVVAALYLAGLHRRVKPSDFGYRRVAPRLAIGVFLAAGASYYVLTALYQAIFGLHGNEKLPRGLGIGQSTAALIGAAAFVCVVAPVAEEFFFRGFIFGALRRWHVKVRGHDLGTWAAAIVTGILFGLVHAGSTSARYLIPLALFGFVLCLVRWRTRSLYPCMALHSVNNSLALGIAQLHWAAGDVLALAVGSVALIAALTLPLAEDKPAPAT